MINVPPGAFHRHLKGKTPLEMKEAKPHLVTANALVFEEAVQLLHALQLGPAALAKVLNELIEVFTAELVQCHQLRRQRHREPAHGVLSSDVRLCIIAFAFS